MAIEWKTINPDFSNSTASMRNALTGFSEAGTVFDKMRQGILDEEQRAIENARAVEAAALAQAELDERIRANQADEANAAAALAEQMRHAKATEAVAAAGLKLQQDEAARIRANDEAGRLAADKLYVMQHGVKGVNENLATLKAAEAMTPEMFEEAKLSGGMINPNTKQAYTNIDEYRKAVKAAYDKSFADFTGKYGLDSAGVEDLSSATGLERQFEIEYRKNGGSGRGTEYLPNYIMHGAALERKGAESDLAAKIEAAKNARLSEIEYGSWDKIVGTLTKSGIGIADAQVIGSTILGVQRALKVNGVNVSNKEVFNRIAETVSLPNDKKGVLGKGWDWLWGGDRASLGKYGMTSAVNDFTKLFTESKPTPENALKNTPNSINDLPQNVQNQANQLLREERIKHENSSDEPFDEQAAEKRIVNEAIKADQKQVSLFIPDIPSLLSNYTNSELKTLGLTKKSNVLTSEQLRALMRIDRSKVLSYVPNEVRRDFYTMF